MPSDDAEVWGESGEVVVGDLRSCVGDDGDEGGFSDAWVSDDADVREELQLEHNSALFAFDAGLCVAWGLVRSSCKVAVSEATFSSHREDGLLSGLGEVCEELECVCVTDERADGDADDLGLAGLPCHALIAAGPSVFSFDDASVSKVEECGDALVGEGDDVCASSSVSPGGATEFDEFFTSEGDGAFAAFSGSDFDMYLINKAHA